MAKPMYVRFEMPKELVDKTWSRRKCDRIQSVLVSTCAGEPGPGRQFGSPGTLNRLR